MATGLVSRTELRASRSSIRRCYTILKASLSAWDEEYANGRSALETFCNANLKHTHIDHLTLGTLSCVQHLKKAASRKIKLLLHQAQESLRESLVSLACVVNDMQSMQHQLESDANSLKATRDIAVFSCLTMKQISSMTARIVISYELQLQARRHLLPDDCTCNDIPSVNSLASKNNGYCLRKKAFEIIGFPYVCTRL
jgi:hypothetical protein